MWRIKLILFLTKWYLMPPCLTLGILRHGSRVKWSNPGKGVAPFATPCCSSNWKGRLRVTLDYGRQLYKILFRSPIFVDAQQLFCKKSSCSKNVYLDLKKYWHSISSIVILTKVASYTDLDSNSFEIFFSLKFF